MIALLGITFGLLAAVLYLAWRLKSLQGGGPAGARKPGAGNELSSQLLFQDAPIAYQEIDLHGTVVRVNRKDCEMRGLDASQILGKPVWDLYPEDQKDLVRTQVERRLRSARVPPGPVRRKAVRADNEVLHLEVHERVLASADGEVTGLLSASAEMTGAPSAGVKAAGELRAALDRMPDMVLRLDADGLVIEGHGGGGDFFARAGDLAGKPVQGALPAEDGLRLVQAMSRMRTIQETVTCEFEIERPDGADTFEARLSPGQNAETVAVFRKVTDLKQAEAKLAKAAEELRLQNDELETALEHAREATELKSRFLANMSHAIRTPMNGILGMMEFLLATELSEEQREYTTSVKHSAGALLTLINDMLDVSKIEAGRMKLEKIPFDLALTVEEVTAMCAGRARSKGVEFVCTMSPDVPNYLMGDPTRLRQILNNLIDNAIKFTDRGRIGIRTEKVGEGEDSITVGFLVQDTGIGFSEEQHARLFDGFVQAEMANARKQGAGLGLAISKQLVEMMNGEIGARSVQGQGSTFYFTIMLGKAPAQNLAAEPQPVRKTAPEKSLAGAGVILLAPKAVVTDPVRKMLETWQCPFIHASSAEELTTALRDSVIDRSVLRVGLIDLDMPGVAAMEIAGNIKYDLGLKDLQLVAITSVPLRGDADRLHQLGYAGYLNKPLRSNVLHGTMMEVLELKQRASQTVGPTPLVTRHTISQSSRWKAAGSQPKILLVEDNSINQRVALSLLQKLGLKADVADSGQQALSALERVAYDLILMDCHMPEMDGYETTAEIRRREGAGSRTPICAITANALAGDREKCLAAGMDDYVSKPIALSDLQAALEHLLPPPAAPEPELQTPSTN